VASYDEEGARAIAQAREAAEALPSDGWLARLRENAPIGPLEALLAATRAVVHARDESGGQEAGYGLETEIAQMDGAFIEVAGRAQEALEALRQPSPGWRCGWKRSWRTAPTGSTGRRARIEGARGASAGGPIWSPGGSPCSAASAAPLIPISSTGWRWNAPTGASGTSASIATISIR
jgi:ATP-dependent DNA helicase DinG